MSNEKLMKDLKNLHDIGDRLVRAWKLNDDCEAEWSDLCLLETANGATPEGAWNAVATTDRGKELRALGRIRRFDLKNAQVEYDKTVRVLDIQIALEPHRLTYSSE